MSSLRIFGCIIGILGLLATFWVYRGPRWRRSSFILLSLVNISLITVSVNPNVLNALRDALALHEAYRGRIIALLILSNLFLLFYAFFTRLKLDNLHFQFDKLVRHLGGKEIEKGLELLDHVKPIMILMPAFNEEENLKELLPNMPKQIQGFDVGILVIDDGSEDGTFATAAQTRGVSVVRNPINRGGGAALRLGYDILRSAGASICVTMDADGQHRPEDIGPLILPIIQDEYDGVIGSRLLGSREKGGRLRIAGVYLFGMLISVLLGKKITDPSSGFRAFRMESVSGIELREDQYHTSELIIEAVKKGLRIGEVPIRIMKRKHGKSKKGKDLAYGLHFARIIFKTWWR